MASRGWSLHEDKPPHLQGPGCQRHSNLPEFEVGFNGISMCRVQGPHLLPYAIRSLQGYPGELVQSSSMDVTLDDVLTILDKHYNNVKALDMLNKELFQLWMVDNETVLDWGIHLSRHLQVLATSFPDHFPPDHVAELKRDCFYGGLPKQLKVMVAYLKVGLQVRTYSDYLRAAQEAEK